MINKDQFLQLPITGGRRLHFIGIGGIGMSAIARIMLEANFEVSGSDLEINHRCRKLQQLGAKIAPAGHRPENYPGDLRAAISSSAVDPLNPELTTVLKKGGIVWRRGEFLGELSHCYERPVAIAGSHGKSSTCAMLSWILLKNDLDIGMMVGAEYNDDTPHARLGDGGIFVTEADESDLSFVELCGELGIITNISDDHAWSTKAKLALLDGFRCFAMSFRKVIYVASPVTNSMLEKCEHCRGLYDDDLEHYQKFLPGWMCGFEKLNGALALAAAEHFGISPERAGAALASYPGIQRRMCEIVNTADGKVTVVEDYAHHPKELKASLELLKERYPRRRMLVIFQPHRYARLQRYFDQYADILSSSVDKLYVPPVFAAWNEVGEVNNVSLADAVNDRKTCALAVDDDYPALAAAVAAEARNGAEPALVAVIGAGDVNKVLKPLKECLV